MTIIDNNAITYIFKKNIVINTIYFITPDLKEEAELLEQIFNKKIPRYIKDIVAYPSFIETEYINNYKEMVNKYGTNSFYNMKGFGDISILAAIKTINDNPQNNLFTEEAERIEIVTEDQGLIKKIKKEFGNNIIISDTTSL